LNLCVERKQVDVDKKIYLFRKRDINPRRYIKEKERREPSKSI
jgi:hypothetical protein